MNYRVLTPTALWESPSATAWLYIAIQIASSIGVVPVLVAKFPTAETALWLLLSTILGITVLADFGFSQTVVRVASFYFAGATELPSDLASLKSERAVNSTPNYVGLARLSGTTKRIYGYIGLASLALLGAYGYLLTSTLIIDSPEPTRLVVSLVLVVIVGAVNILTTRHIGLLQGVHRIQHVNQLRVIVLTVELIAMIGVAMLSLGVPYLCAILLLRSLFIFWRVGRLTDDVLLAQVTSADIQYDQRLFDAMWVPTKKQGGLAFGSYFINHGSTVVVSQVGNPAIIAAFLFTKRILEAGRTLAQVPFVMNVQAIFAPLATGNLLKARHSVAKYVGLSLGLLTAFSVGLILLGPFGLSLFGIQALLLPASLLIVMCVALILETHHSFHALVYLSTNQVPFFWGALVSAVAIIGLGYLAAGPFGLVGVLLVQLLVQLLYNNWYPVYLTLRMLDWPIGQYFTQLATLGVRYGNSLLTIAIPVYNRTDFFAEALSSALNQTVKVRVVVVDNDSPHQEFERIVREIGSDDVRYIRNPQNLGMEGNWNACIAHCTSPYLSILHDDDALHPQFVEAWLATRPQSDAVWTVGCAIGESAPFKTDGTQDSFITSVTKLRVQSVPLTRFRYATLSPFPGVIFPAATDSRFDAELHGAADTYFWFALAKRYPVVYTSARLAFYRRSPHQASSNLFATIIEKLFVVRDSIGDYLGPSKIDEKLDRFTRLVTIESYQEIYNVTYQPPPSLSAQVASLQAEFSSPIVRYFCRALLRLRKL